MKENSIEEDIEIVEKFNKENRFRDCGKINNAIEHILSDYKRVLKENEELKRLLNGNLYEDYKHYKNLAGEYQGSCISKQKIKDKMEKLNKEIKNGDVTDAIFKIKQQQILQELIREV